MPEVTVHPRNPYEVTAEPGEFNEWRVRQWIEYCKPRLSKADALGIRKYVFAIPNLACEAGLAFE